MFQRIFVPVDGSTASFDALNQALQIAACEQAVVTVLCVIDARISNEARVYLPMQDKIMVSDAIGLPSKITSTYQAWAQQVVDRAQARGEAVGVEMHTEIVTGVPYHEIIARSSHYDLLVMGTWETSSTYPGPFLAGNTLWYIVAHTHLPILFVPASFKNKKLQTIAMAYDDSREARDALQLAATWAHVWGLTLIVLTVQQNGSQAQTLLHKARVRAQPAVPRLVAREGDPLKAILNVATQYHCDLIALGVHASHSLFGYSLGKVTDILLRTTSLPVLLSH